MAVEDTNDCSGPGELGPTLLVYGTLSRLGLPHDPPTPSTISRVIALRKATSAMSKHFANRQVHDVFRTQNGPDVFDIYGVPIGGHVLVHRPKLDHWDEPYSVLDIDGEGITVILPPPLVHPSSGRHS